MPIIGDDERRVIHKFDVVEDITNKPLTSITAIDSTIDARSGFGTGVVISPNYVLTAAHVILDKSFNPARFSDEIRVSSSNQQKGLGNRAIDADPGDPGSNVNRDTGLFLPFDSEFRTARANSEEENRFDIGLIELNNTDLISDAPPVGLTAFIEPRTVREEQISIQTAGYPVDNVPNTFPPETRDNDGILDRQGNTRPARDPEAPNDFSVQTRDLVLAPGILDDEGEEITGTIFNAQGRRIQYSENIDTVAGQSGSPVWHTLEGDDPRVLAVHSRGGGFRNAGALIDKEAYDLILEQIEGDADPDLLPENAIIGSDPISRPPGLPDLPGDDEIVGTYRRERILGGGGDDTIFGGGADDRLEGEAGDDILAGGQGDDLIDGGTNIPTLNLLDNLLENDVAVFSGNISEYDISSSSSGGFLGTPIGEETVTIITHLNGGIDGTDRLTNIEYVQFRDQGIALPFDPDDPDPIDPVNFTGGSDNDTLIGNALDNFLSGNSGNDRLEAGAGDDTVTGGSGSDRIFGQDGNDSINGGSGNDYVNAGNGRDTVEGDLGRDRFYGVNGTDFLYGEDDRDSLFGGDDNDFLYAGNGNDSLNGGLGDDKLYGQGGFDRAYGREGNDSLFGANGEDFLSGGEGNDSLNGGSGNDELYGNDGFDLVYGRSGHDVLSGEGGNDQLYGESGADSLNGGENNDLLSGGFGNDSLEGGSGGDFFLFKMNAPYQQDLMGTDRIVDFGDGDDLIRLDKTAFAALTSISGTGFSQQDEFAVVSADSLVATANALILYSSSTGNLFYNENGAAAGLGDGGWFAVLDNAPDLNASDLQLVS